MLLYGATCVSLVWMYYTFAREKVKADEEKAVASYIKSHESPEQFAAALAAVEQAEMLEEFVRKYSAARERAENKAEQLKQEKMAEGAQGSPA
jgi:NNP family nitrate/nitrite transporter-like MFS transporter